MTLMIEYLTAEDLTSELLGKCTYDIAVALIRSSKKSSLSHYYNNIAQLTLLHLLPFTLACCSHPTSYPSHLFLPLTTNTAHPTATTHPPPPTAITEALQRNEHGAEAQRMYLRSRSYRQRQAFRYCRQQQAFRDCRQRQAFRDCRQRQT